MISSILTTEFELVSDFFFFQRKHESSETSLKYFLRVAGGLTEQLKRSELTRFA